MQFLSTVEDVFHIAGRGCVIVPAVPRSTLDFHLRAKDPIQIRQVDGRILNTHIISIEVLCGPEVKDRIAFLLPNEVGQDVAAGAEIWMERE